MWFGLGRRCMNVSTSTEMTIMTFQSEGRKEGRKRHAEEIPQALKSQRLHKIDMSMLSVRPKVQLVSHLISTDTDKKSVGLSSLHFDGPKLST